MKTELFAIYDAKAKIYNRPFHQVNKAVAERAAATFMQNNEDIKHNPEDFSLHHFGSFDDVNGKFELHEQPELVLSFKSIGVE